MRLWSQHLGVYHEVTPTVGQEVPVCDTTRRGWVWEHSKCVGSTNHSLQPAASRLSPGFLPNDLPLIHLQNLFGRNNTCSEAGVHCLRCYLAAAVTVRSRVGNRDGTCLSAPSAGTISPNKSLCKKSEGVHKAEAMPFCVKDRIWLKINK